MAVMFLTPIVFGFDMFKPLKNSLSDFEITDIVDSKIVPRDDLLADTNMIIINTEVQNQELSNVGYAKVINTINQYNPKVIGIKQIIKKSGNEKQDRILAMVLNNCNNLVMSFKFSKFNESSDEFDGMIKSDKIFTENAKLAYDNFKKIDDERFYTIRKYYPTLKNHGKEYKSFSQQIVELYNPAIAKKYKNRNNEQEYIFYMGHYQFFRIEAQDILEGNFDPALVENKIVLLGRISTKNSIDSNMALIDVFFTPLNESYTGKAFPDMYGTILHANIISMILNNNLIDSMPLWLIYIITILLAYINMVIFTYIIVKNKKWYEIISLFVFVIESVLILIVTVIGFVLYRYEMDLTMPIFVLAASVFTFEIYNSSLKPLTIKMYFKFLHKG
jgi:CHASE2 domain-containing sensor protein